ncbi:hypothetical protein CHCC14821_0996 [Bacillus paralicheniformis]|nr:hypothetical protein CHCC14821_0996 [Bacillus paralicheniformis]
MFRSFSRLFLCLSPEHSPAFLFHEATVPRKAPGSAADV